MKKLAAVPAHDYFRATGKELREWAESDPAAQAEIERRAAKRAAKKESAAA